MQYWHTHWVTSPPSKTKLETIFGFTFEALYSQFEQPTTFTLHYSTTTMKLINHYKRRRDMFAPQECLILIENIDTYKQKQASQPLYDEQADVPPMVIFDASLCSSSTSSSKRSDLEEADVSSLLLEQSLWRNTGTEVDYYTIDLLQDTWDRVKEEVGNKSLGDCLVQQMMEMEPRALNEIPSTTSLGTELVERLDCVLFLLTPDAQVEDLFEFAQCLREQGISPDLLADALPLCIQSLLDLTEKEQQAWNQVMAPALEELEMPSLLWDEPLY